LALSVQLLNRHYVLSSQIPRGKECNLISQQPATYFQLYLTLLEQSINARDLQHVVGMDWDGFSTLSLWIQ